MEVLLLLLNASLVQMYVTEDMDLHSDVTECVLVPETKVEKALAKYEADPNKHATLDPTYPYMADKCDELYCHRVEQQAGYDPDQTFDSQYYKDTPSWPGHQIGEIIEDN